MKKGIVSGSAVLVAAFLTGCGTARWSGHYKHSDASPQLHHDWSQDPGFPSTSSGSTSKQIPVANSQDWIRQFGGYRLQMRMNPSVPKATQDAAVEFLLSRVSSTGQSEPVSGAQMACTARMPNVAGHIHVLASHVDHPEAATGRYVMHPIRFEMGGRWDVIVQVKPPNGDQFYAVFPVEAEGPPWPPNYLPEELRQPKQRS